MFRNQAAFDIAYLRARRYYEGLSRNPNLQWLAPIDLARGWDIYQQARDAAAGILVMGRTTVDEPGRTPDQFGNAITIDDHQGLGIITHRSEAAEVANAAWAPEVTTGGMVMHFYGGTNPPVNWGAGAGWRQGRSGYHFLYNDCWLLGGAHALHDFNLASPRRWSNIWALARADLTATGRELAFLDRHGYHFVKHYQAGTEVATCRVQHRHRARNADFVSLLGALRHHGGWANAYNLVDVAAA